MKRVLFVLLLFLVACGSSGVERCSSAADCTSKLPSAFRASCVDRECMYTPIPGARGNGICEAGEDKCTVPQDCGVCIGNVAGSKWLVQSCVNNVCLPDVASPKPIYQSEDYSGFGDKFRIDTVYSSPFNMKKDLLTVIIALSDQNEYNSDHRIESISVEGTTADRRSVSLADQAIDRPLWKGYSVSSNIVLDFPSSVVEGELSNIVLKVKYSYVSRGSPQERSMQVRLPSKFYYVYPDVVYPCPSSCDDGNPGTRDYCSAQTGYFCRHDPIAGVCGNYICDSNENKCTCPADCGPCSGSVGTHVELTCKSNACVGRLKPGAVINPNTILDERRIGNVDLTVKYQFNDPFNTASDKFVIDFDADGPFTIDTVRVMERSQILAEKSVNKPAGKVEISVPSLPTPEEEHTVSVDVWYSGDREGHYSKSLGKITFIDVK